MSPFAIKQIKSFATITHLSISHTHQKQLVYKLKTHLRQADNAACVRHSQLLLLFLWNN